MLSICVAVENLRKSLSENLTECFNRVGMRWKSTEDPSKYSENTPKVFAFTYDNLEGNYPTQMPAVLLQVLKASSSAEGVVCTMLCHCITVNPAIQEAGVVENIGDDTFRYSGKDNFQADTQIDMNDHAHVRRDLYVSTLQLGEMVYTELARLGNGEYSISGCELNTPSPYMEMFPYCECSIAFNLTLSKVREIINSDVSEYL